MYYLVSLSYIENIVTYRTTSGNTSISSHFMYFSDLTTANFSGVMVLPTCLILSPGTTLLMSQYVRQIYIKHIINNTKQVYLLKQFGGLMFLIGVVRFNSFRVPKHGLRVRGHSRRK